VWFNSTQHEEPYQGGEQLISRRYIDCATVPHVGPGVPPYEAEGWYKGLPGSYGLNWWTNGITPEGRRMWPSAPVHTFAAQGHFNNICLIVPEWRTVIVRLGGDVVIDTDLYDRVFAAFRQAMLPLN
jgi:CubicO group peptidase (beta-lactamase class C family)